MDAPSTSLGKRGLPKFRDILRRAPTDSEVSIENNFLLFFR